MKEEMPKMPDKEKDFKERSRDLDRLGYLEGAIKRAATSNVRPLKGLVESYLFSAEEIELIRGEENKEKDAAADKKARGVIGGTAIMIDSELSDFERKIDEIIKEEVASVMRNILTKHGKQIPAAYQERKNS